MEITGIVVSKEPHDKDKLFMSSSCLIKTFIEASYTNNINTGEKDFLQLIILKYTFQIVHLGLCEFCLVLQRRKDQTNTVCKT